MRKYPSLYEHLNGGFTTVMKQRFVDEFSGATLDVTKWGFNEASGNGTRTIDQDTVDGGYKMITSSSNSSNYMQLKGGGGTIRAFDAESSAFIAVCRAVSTSDVAFYVGLQEDSYFAADHGSNRSNYRLSHRNNLVGTGNTDSSVAIDYAWHTHSATTDGTNCKYSIDGIHQCTATGATLPSDGAGHLEPWWQVYTLNSGTSKKCAIRYFEAWNI